MNSYEECQELKNIKYKNLLLNGNSNSINSETLNTQSKLASLELFLEKESNLNKTEPWNKLDKTEKIKLLKEFVDNILAKEHELSESEIKELYKYFGDCLDKKKLQLVKDVTYDKSTKKIKDIPCLSFNSTTRKFTLKRSEKRVSTLKSLGNGTNKK
jgi:hypothetical protein